MTGKPEPLPVDYMLYTWRKQMRVGYFEALRTPLEVIKRDLEFAGLEEEYGKVKEPEPDGLIRQ